MAEIFGYARCSTSEERQDIDRQRRDLKALGVTEDKNIYWEYESGTVKNRPELQKLLERVKPGDTIITTEVSRLTRSTQHLCEILQQIRDQNLCLVIGSSFTVDCRTDEINPMTKGMLMMWGVFSEMERDMISQRVRSGMENARVKGKKIGRPKMTADDIPEKFWRLHNAYKNGQLNVTELAGAMGCTRSTVYKYIALAEGREF